MTSYKTIVRNWVKMNIVDYLQERYSGTVINVRFCALTISEDRCLFATRATVRFIFNRNFIVSGEVLSSGSVIISEVEDIS